MESNYGNVYLTDNVKKIHSGGDSDFKAMVADQGSYIVSLSSSVTEIEDLTTIWTFAERVEFRGTREEFIAWENNLDVVFRGGQIPYEDFLVMLYEEVFRESYQTQIVCTDGIILDCATGFMWGV